MCVCVCVTHGVEAVFGDTSGDVVVCLERVFDAELISVC